MTLTPENLGVGQPERGRSDVAHGVWERRRGVNEQIIREISMMNHEPAWMLQRRLESFNHFNSRPMPNWGGGLSEICFDDIGHMGEGDEQTTNGTHQSPSVADDDHNYGASSTAQHESEAVFRRNSERLRRQGVVFTDMHVALRQHPDLVRQYFGTVVGVNDNKFSALNTSVWSGGSFIYVPPGVEVEMPLQAHFAIDSSTMGPFERTLIIADEGAKVHYIEGCSAPIYTSDPLHSAVAEVVVKPSAHVTYTTIQNWSNNVFNMATKRATVGAEGHMEWIDGDIGSRFTMKHPAVWLVGPKASGGALSVAYAGQAQYQHIGAQMVHAAPETTSKIMSKSILDGAGHCGYRGRVRIEDQAWGCASRVHCDTLLLDGDLVPDAHPGLELGSHDAQIDHEAVVSRVTDSQLFYLMSRGLSQQQAIAMVVNGFIEPVTRTLPMEYAVEWSRLIELQMEGSIG